MLIILYQLQKKIYYLNKSDGITDGNPLEWIDPSSSICNSIIKYLTFVDIPWDNSKTDEDNLKNDKITKILYYWEPTQIKPSLDPTYVRTLKY